MGAFVRVNTFVWQSSVTGREAPGGWPASKPLNLPGPPHPTLCPSLFPSLPTLRTCLIMFKAHHSASVSHL